MKVEIFREYFIKVKDNMMDNFFCFLRKENKFIVYQVKISSIDMENS